MCEITSTPPPAPPVEVIFSWHLNVYYSHTSVQACVAKLNDLANRREFNLTSPSQNRNN